MSELGAPAASMVGHIVGGGSATFWTRNGTDESCQAIGRVLEFSRRWYDYEFDHRSVRTPRGMSPLGCGFVHTACRRQHFLVPRRLWIHGYRGPTTETSRQHHLLSESRYRCLESRGRDRGYRTSQGCVWPRQCSPHDDKGEFPSLAYVDRLRAKTRLGFKN